MQIESAKLAWCVGLFLSGPLWANDEPAAAVNLVRDVSGAAAQVSVDSSFAGYRPDVLIDGHWLADGQETPRTFGDPDRLGNGGNTWVSSESAVEHWIQLTWPQDVQFNTVEIIWSQPEWKPQAVRMEYLVNERWMPLVPEVAGWEPIDRQSVVVAPVRATRSIRIVQPCGGAGSREFLAAQEVAVYRHGGERAASQGVRALNEQQMSRLIPQVPRQNIARLHEDAAGAAIALGYRADGRTSPLPALVDGEMRVAAAVPESATAVGVEWPIRHVVEKASLTFSGADSCDRDDGLGVLRWPGLANGESRFDPRSVCRPRLSHVVVLAFGDQWPAGPFNAGTGEIPAVRTGCPAVIGPPTRAPGPIDLCTGAFCSGKCSRAMPTRHSNNWRRRPCR